MCPYNPFDLTKVWFRKDHPLIEVGVMELNRNPENYFAEVEMSDDDRRAAGIAEGLVRISVGVEDPRDLLHDFRQALDAL